jgi:Carboxypeptidase regulatory-like domain
LAEPILHQGRVLWDDGTIVPGALVAVTSGTAPTPEIAIRANANGEFRIALPSGTFGIEARAPNGATGSVDVVVGTQPTVIEVVLKLKPNDSNQERP